MYRRPGWLAGSGSDMAPGNGTLFVGLATCKMKKRSLQMIGVHRWLPFVTLMLRGERGPD